MKSALISYKELENLIQADDGQLVLLDATFVLPNSPVDPYVMYQHKRIGNAVFFDIDQVADHNSSLPHMLPSAADFEEMVSAMGISNDSRIIVYGQAGLALGPARVWWMFKIFGHDCVSILNGSMMDWEEKGYPVNTDAPSMPQAASFKAKFNSDMVVDIDQVDQISQHRAAHILDARPAERFSGLAQEPRAGMRSGHIPNSINIPTGTLIDPQTGGLKDTNQLTKVIPLDILQADAPPVMTCGSGVTACVIALAFHELGHGDFRIYDGSWSEWGQSEKIIYTQ